MGGLYLQRQRRVDRRRCLVACCAWLLGALVCSSRVVGDSLADQLGRNEIRVFAAPWPILPGATIVGSRLPQRLEARGYRRVHRQPQNAGEFFWGHERFWIHRRANSWPGHRRAALLLGLDLRRSDGRIERIFAHQDGGEKNLPKARLAPRLLAESLQADRARRLPIDFDELPEYVWKSVLAIEDARFFEHSGVDGRSVARALLRNFKAGRITQGGSTITQQLIKMRDLSPKRSLGRKVSEAMRAVALEAEHDKREILQTYLDHVYFGHLGGVAIYGIGAAAEAYFSRSANSLELGQAALLAGLIQGPNRLSPNRHPERALVRQRLVLDRLETLGWAEVEAARRAGLPPLKLQPPAAAGPTYLLDLVRDEIQREAPRHTEQGRGVIVESALDAELQDLAEEAVERGLAELRRTQRQLRGRPLHAALVTLDGASGEVLAYVGGDPAQAGDAFDRARRARRQPGSTVKPLVLLEAFDDCGDRQPLYPARQVSDQPLRLDLPAGAWEPRNPDGKHRQQVSLREATVRSLNIPFVRIARWCGFEATAKRLRRAGLDLPPATPPAFVLGAIETSPLQLAAAYTVFSDPGKVRQAVPILRLRRPGGRTLERGGSRARRLSRPSSAYLVRDLLRDNAERGTARGARPGDLEVWAKTGTSSDQRDAWLVGGGGGLVTVVWLGLDDNGKIGLSASAAAAPIWRRFMAQAIPTRPQRQSAPPTDLEQHWIEARSGLRVAASRRGSTEEIFRRGAMPPRRRLWKSNPAVAPIQ